jgi:hypothetical protein
MAATKHDAIVKAIVDALLVAPALASGNVDDDIEFDELVDAVTEAVAVELLDSQPVSAVYGRVDWRSIVRVACYARNDKPGANGRASSQLGATAYARLMTAPTLGGLAEGIEQPRLSRDKALRNKRAGVTYLDFPVRHVTTARALTT